MNNSQKAYQLGQSIWYDNIQRRLLENGQMGKMIGRGEIYGVTSNPSIFNNAITKSDDYNDDLVPLIKSGKTAGEIFEFLSIKDVRDTADLFSNIYDTSEGFDGYVSLEVNPELANETDATCKEAQRLWDLVDKPNLMIKIPATKEGLPAITRSIANGLNINVTLIFSQRRYEEVMAAYLAGLEQREANGKPINRVASVASFFVSRIDTKVDNYLREFVALDNKLVEVAAKIQGKVAIANAKLAYQSFKKVIDSDRFIVLKEKGAQLQRPLWASTSTKNPAYSDLLYVDNLIGPNTVNTIPPKTLEAFNHHGIVGNTLEHELKQAQEVLEDLDAIGISLAQVTHELELEGVAAFRAAFKNLLNSIETRRQAVVG